MAVVDEFAAQIEQIGFGVERGLDVRAVADANGNGFLRAVPMGAAVLQLAGDVGFAGVVVGGVGIGGEIEGVQQHGGGVHFAYFSRMGLGFACFGFVAAFGFRCAGTRFARFNFVEICGFQAADVGDGLRRVCAAERNAADDDLAVIRPCFAADDAPVLHDADGAFHFGQGFDLGGVKHALVADRADDGVFGAARQVFGQALGADKLIAVLGFQAA